MLKPLLFRASSVADIMTDAKTKGETLSAGAKTAIIKMAREFVYGFDFQISSKYMEKGTQCEGKSIELLNSVLFSSYEKNAERRANDWITGEPDIVANDAILDIKTSWSLETFPVLAELGEDKTYYWQMQSYMWLFDKPRAEICYCMVSTPENLIGYENKAIHMVDHIAPELRVTRWKIDRDDEAINKMKVKIEAAREFYAKIIERIGDEHK